MKEGERQNKKKSELVGVLLKAHAISEGRNHAVNQKQEQKKKKKEKQEQRRRVHADDHTGTS